jgi:hypothetical protein
LLLEKAAQAIELASREASCPSEADDFQQMQDIVSQKIELFITTTMRTSNPI